MQQSTKLPILKAETAKYKLYNLTIQISLPRALKLRASQKATKELIKLTRQSPLVATKIPQIITLFIWKAIWNNLWAKMLRLNQKPMRSCLSCSKILRNTAGNSRKFMINSLKFMRKGQAYSKIKFKKAADSVLAIVVRMFSPARKNNTPSNSTNPNKCCNLKKTDTVCR